VYGNRPDKRNESRGPAQSLRLDQRHRAGAGMPGRETGPCV
jgi:hypothetical protein